MPPLTAGCRATQAPGVAVNSAAASRADEGMEPPAREGAYRAGSSRRGCARSRTVGAGVSGQASDTNRGRLSNTSLTATPPDAEVAPSGVDGLDREDQGPGLSRREALAEVDRARAGRTPPRRAGRRDRR